MLDPRDHRPPILCYHKVDVRRELGVTRVAPRVFRRQMEALAASGVRTLGSAELVTRLAGGTVVRPRVLAKSPDATRPSPHPAIAAPAPAVVLTFDDGYAALAEHAFPVLADLGLKALVFVVTGFAGRDNDWDVHYGWRRFRHLSWDELARWRERGIEVHSHGATHARLSWISLTEAAEELGRSREEILRRTGVAPLGVSYPFGAVNRWIASLASDAGYRLGFAGPQGLAGVEADSPMGLRRRPVYAWDVFRPPLVLRGGLRGAVAMAAARLTNRIAVGTTLFQRLSGRRHAASR
jgi:peptidoglycan/xylan/chitin deacetylase (PgdA/CDA1 family)